MNKKILKLLTIAVFLLMLFVRVYTRIATSLWVDEIEQIASLTSLSYLIFDYLPKIPAGFPGHYLLLLPINLVFPKNIYLLFLPGLISHILVFMLIPNIVNLFDADNKKDLALSVLFARFLVSIDPTLVYQSVEIRPYSVLPLLWLVIFLSLYKLFFSKKQLSYLFFKLLFFIILILWHAYSILMILSIMLFFLHKEKWSKKFIKNSKKSFCLLGAGLALSFPCWLYFSKGITYYQFDTFIHLKVFVEKLRQLLTNAYFLKTNEIFYLLFFICLVFLLLYFCYYIFRSKKQKKIVNVSIFQQVLYLVIFPIFAILFLDYLNNYWFLFRQISWVLLPFYLSISIIIVRFLKKRITFY